MCDADLHEGDGVSKVVLRRAGEGASGGREEQGPLEVVRCRLLRVSGRHEVNQSL